MPLDAEPKTIPQLGNTQDQALAWFARLQDSKTSQSDRADFADWLAASADHQTAYNKVLQLWQSPALTAALGEYSAIPLHPGYSKPPARRWAATACIVLTSGWFLMTSGWIARWQADITTGTGEQRRVVLADGSALTLNTDSAVKLDYAGERRGVTLLNGEAYFEVQPDKSQPFVVSTEQGTVRVVGTRFSIKTGKTAQVDVESGIVVCTAQHGDNRQLTADQHTAISVGNVDEISSIDAGHAFAWLKGRLIFQDQPLADVVAELDRYQPGAIVIADAKLGQIRITGNYKLEDTEAILSNLANIAGAKVFRLSPYLTILKS